MASGAAKQAGLATTTEVDGLGYARAASVAPGKVKQEVRLDRIVIKDRLRWPTQAAKENLAVSFRENGQLQPILIRPTHTDADGDWFQLVVGATRCGAAEICKWDKVTAEIRVMTDDEARLAEIDENVVRPDLSPHERAIFIQERLKVWARLNPDRTNASDEGEIAPRRGRPKNSAKFAELLGAVPPTMGFGVETAKDLGISERTIRNALSIARGLSDDVHARIANSRIAKNEGLLRQVAGIPDKAEQLRVVETLLSEAAPSFSDALVIASGRTPIKAPENPVDVSVKQLAKLWKGASKTHREAMLHWLQGQALPAGWTLDREGADD